MQLPDARGITCLLPACKLFGSIPAGSHVIEL